MRGPGKVAGLGASTVLLLGVAGWVVQDHVSGPRTLPTPPTAGAVVDPDPDPDPGLDGVFAPTARATGLATARPGGQGSAGCGPLRRETYVDSPHLRPGEVPRFAGFPPTSGPHDVEVLSAGVLDAPLVDGPGGARTRSWARAVHSLEHGYVVVLHGPALPAGDVASLRRLARGQRKVVVAPEPSLQVPLVLLAWLTRQDCERLVPDEVTAFVARHREAGLSPEPLAP